MTTDAPAPPLASPLAPGQAPPAGAARLAALRQRCDAFRPRQPDPDLHRDLRHGWLLPSLLHLEAVLWGRWDYWLACHDAAGEPDGNRLPDSDGSPKGSGLPEAPIPRLDFLSFPHPATRQMLEASLDGVPRPQHGPWRSWSGWAYFDYFLSWLLFGLGHKGQGELPAEPLGCAGASMRLYQTFCLDALLLWPHDYWGDLLQESGYGRKQGFYPTPHTLCEAMARMLLDEKKDHRRETVCDPCVGTGRMLLYASNSSLRLYGMDIDPVLCKATLVNGYLYAPWLVRPLPHLDPELSAMEQGCDRWAPSISDALAAAAPPHARDYPEGYLAATEHDAHGQLSTAPLLKRRRRRALDPAQLNLFD